MTVCVELVLYVQFTVYTFYWLKDLVVVVFKYTYVNVHTCWS